LGRGAGGTPAALFLGEVEKQLSAPSAKAEGYGATRQPLSFALDCTWRNTKELPDGARQMAR
jgi:hypothetical protein